MDWILEHFRILLLVAGAIAYIVKTRRPDASEEDLPPKKDGQDLPADAVLRRLQEQIARARAEREKAVPPPLVAPRPVATSPIPDVIARWKAPPKQPQEAPPPLPMPVRPRDSLDEEAPEVFHHASLEAPVEVAPVRYVAESPLPSLAHAKTGLARLDHLNDVKRAWVASEIFGSPVSLRR